ncbi:thiamine phosphate synthase [Permianibacter sp. IMCC34836]|uniref:thiamine phosphate synthase n=1 Tax=Permianibacter fluminis TaxID=2738515 RepID=UPI0015533CAA|nr:thiamine phosphate synthase [Permianibacter fluminis]NQD39091.1 thiamine phosphate synthase [Permianibacter fluminis]
MAPAPLSGLYAITDPNLLHGDRLLAGVEAALRGGARVIQYRDKAASPAEQRERALALRACCHRHGGKLLINDDVALALAVDADGVHLGQSDGQLAAARAALPGKLLGVTCHSSLELAAAAAAAGADYLAFGRFFPSQTKPSAPPCDVATLTAARHRFALPLLAIGGVTPDNGGQLRKAGADLLAAIHGVFGADDIEAAARRYAALFE